MSLVSVWVRNSLLLCERVEGVAKGEIVEITNVHASAVHSVEMVVGWLNAGVSIPGDSGEGLAGEFCIK